MNKLILPVLTGLGIAFFVVLLNAVYILDETEQAVITRFGKPQGDPIVEPGLKWKTPFLDTVNRFDNRFLGWDGNPDQVTTRDKRYIFVDTFARWRISDARKYLEAVSGDERFAQSRLDDIIDGQLRSTIANHDLVELVRDSGRKFTVTSEDLPPEGGGENFDVKIGRSGIAKIIMNRVTLSTAELGIEVLDFQFKRILYTDGVKLQVYERMKSERFRIAEDYRSQGLGEAARIAGETERSLKEIRSLAYRKELEIRGKADAKAAVIYAEAYGQDAEFFRFMMTLGTYRETFDENTTLLLTTSGDYLKYLDSVSPKE